MPLVDQHILETVFSSPPKEKYEYLISHKELLIRKREFTQSRHWNHMKEELLDWKVKTNTAAMPVLSYSLFNEYFLSGERETYDQAYYEKRRRLHALTLLLLMDQGDADTLFNVQHIMWDMCSENTWCLPAHLHYHTNQSLFKSVDMAAAETAFSLMETIYLLKETLPTWFTSYIVEMVTNRVLIPFFEETNELYWETWTNNWSSVCASAIGLTLLYYEQLPNNNTAFRVKPFYVERLLRCLNTYLQGFEEDGGSKEGLAYWRYGFGYFVYFIDALKIRTDGSVDLYQIPKVKKIASFASLLWFSNGKSANFSDSLEDIGLHTGMLTRLKRNIPDVKLPHLSTLSTFADGMKTWGNCSRNLLWSNVEVLNSSHIIPFCYQPNTQIVVTKKLLSTGEMIAAAIKGGSNREPHNHNDLGHFILHINGENLIKDIGPAQYSKEYFSSKRYCFLEASSLGHSVPVINQYTQCHQEWCQSTVIYVKQKDNKCMSAGYDLTNVYPDPDLKRFTRTFESLLTNKEFLFEIHDYFLFLSEKCEVTERFVCSKKPEIKEDTKICWPEDHLELHFSMPDNIHVEQVSPSREEKPKQTYIISIHYSLENKENALQFCFHYKIP